MAKIFQNVVGKYVIEIPRRKGNPSRVANLLVKFCEVTIKPSWYTKKKANNIPIKINAIFANEHNAAISIADDSKVATFYKDM